MSDDLSGTFVQSKCDIVEYMLGPARIGLSFKDKSYCIKDEEEGKSQQQRENVSPVHTGFLLAKKYSESELRQMVYIQCDKSTNHTGQN